VLLSETNSHHIKIARPTCTIICIMLNRPTDQSTNRPSVLRFRANDWRVGVTTPCPSISQTIKPINIQIFLTPNTDKALRLIDLVSNLVYTTYKHLDLSTYKHVFFKTIKKKLLSIQSVAVPLFQNQRPNVVT
jgi:hypothetical protein